MLLTVASWPPATLGCRGAWHAASQPSARPQCGGAAETERRARSSPGLGGHGETGENLEKAAFRGGRASERRKSETAMEWGGVKVTGAAAEWLQSQMELGGGTFEPSPIQEEAMSRIYDGESCCIHAPTGTGKTLCYLLPLLQRFTEEAARAPARGLRFLILVPTAVLQVQTVALARALLGPGKAENVTLMRRDADNTSEPSNIVVATPRHIRDLLDEPMTQPLWLRALGQLDWVVVDEADQLVDKWHRVQRKKASREGRVLPAVALLKEIELQTTKAGRRDEWQLVGATATLNRRTFRNVKYSAGIDLALIRAPGSTIPEAEAQETGGQYGDGTTGWPDKLRHRVRVPIPFRFPKVMSVAAKTIYELEAKRVLVVLATTGRGGRAPSSVYGRSLVLSQLRFRLEDLDDASEQGRLDDGRFFQVISISEAIEAAAKLWSSEGSRQRVRDERHCQVIVAAAQEIRGMHLDFIDAVVLIGDPNNISDYMHAAGRTCRYQPGSAEPLEGTVVSIVEDSVANKMMKWSNLSGFKLVEVPMKRNVKTGEPAERLLTKRQKQAAAEIGEALKDLDDDFPESYEYDEPELYEYDEPEFREAEHEPALSPPSVWS
ncbi:ddx31 [Symbiodinium necroappetens]|uniref:ATP-dependent RNA helicase n=1 Tax=Symbiodinium necroappetens TaxID=1628268 RepID=A0A812J4E9_9DINO|nr:ddx31 [Symbiodinium necroappetens]